MKGPGGKRSLAAFAKAAQLPEDFLKGNILVSMQGQERAVIENFKGISSYTTQEIRLITNRKKICIAGKNLRIDSYTKEEVEITGIIDRIEYL